MARTSIAGLALSAGVSLPLSDPAYAGPPFETDDPAPTATHHWELYLFTDAGGRGAEFDGSSGIDINHGLLPGVQFTVTLPLDISSSGGPAVAVGDIDIGTKYRFWDQWNGGWSAAFAPILTIPVHSEGAESDRVSVRLPFWIGWESSSWAVYGGGGPALSGDADGRDSLFGGVVLARKLSPDAQLGMEMTLQGPEHVGDRGEAGLDMGCIVPVAAGLVLHAAAGPRFIDGESARYRFYMALAAQF